MGRYFFEVAYNGKKYHGWQIQKNAHSVQEEFNNALKQLFGIAVETVASGRTDTGVHAEQQYIHLDLLFQITADHVFKLNKILPFDIVIRSVHSVQNDAHARFDAVSRKYEYRIVTEKSPFMVGVTYCFPRILDTHKMNICCEILKKQSDFECFSKVRTEVNHFLCTITEANWERKNELLIFSIEANRFLRGMVRAIVGTMLEVGMGRLSIENFEKIIIGKNRKAAGRSVPPEGLFLTQIKYPERLFIKKL